MEIIYNKNYISREMCPPHISRQRTVKALTRQSIQILESRGLKVVRGGKQLV